MPSAEDLRKEADRREVEARAAFDRAKADAQRELDRALGAVRALRVAADAMDGRMETLTSRNGYVTVPGMPSIETVAKHPGPLASEGAASRVAAELGFSSLSDLAEALKEPYPTVRAWNMKGRGIPERVVPAIERLRKSRKFANR